MTEEKNNKLAIGFGGMPLRGTLCCFAVLLVTALFCIFLPATSAHAATTKVNIPYTQVFTTDSSSVDNTFTYTFTADASGSPMPTGSTGSVYTFTAAGNTSGSIDIDAAGSADGTYTYVIKDASTHSEGYTYELRTYKVTLYVLSGGTDTNVTIEDIDAKKKVSVVELDPSYTAPIGVPNVQLTKVADVVRTNAGATIVYTITATNVGDAGAIGVWVKDYIPEHTTYVSCDNGGEVGPSQSDVKYVNWFISDLPVNASQDLTLTVKTDEVDQRTDVLNIANYNVTGNPNPPTDEWDKKDPTNGASSKAEVVVEAKSNPITPVKNTTTVTTSKTPQATTTSTGAKTADQAPFLPFAAVAALAVGVVMISRRKAHE